MLTCAEVAACINGCQGVAMRS